MTTTPRGAPELVSAQAVPETTVNEQIWRTEAGAGRFMVADRVTAPPGTCTSGAVYLIIATATGAFAGKENQLAIAVGTNAASGWFYRTPSTIDEGALAYVQDEDVDYRWSGAAWASVSASSYTDEQARDAIGTALVAGANVSITVNDAGDTITIDAVGGGGAGSLDLSEYTSATPTTPGTGLTLFDRKRGGNHALAAVSPLANFEIGKALYSKPVVLWEPNWSSGGSGFGTNVSQTNGATPNPSSSNLISSLLRNSYTTASSAGSSAGIRINQIGTFWRGNGTGLGGFFALFRFAAVTVSSTHRWFVGLTSSGSVLTNAEPSSVVNMIGIGADSTDSNVQVMTNDASGTATKADLGSNYPAKTASVIYELRLFCKPNDTTLYYSIERFSGTDGSSLFLAEGTVTSDMPVNSTLLVPQLWVNNTATTGNPEFDLFKFYAELG